MLPLFFPKPSNGKKTASEQLGLILYGLGWVWLILWLILEFAALIIDGALMFSEWPSTPTQWVLVIGVGFLLYPTIGLVGFFLGRGSLYLLARR